MQRSDLVVADSLAQCVSRGEIHHPQAAFARAADPRGRLRCRLPQDRADRRASYSYRNARTGRELAARPACRAMVSQAAARAAISLARNSQAHSLNGAL